MRSKIFWFGLTFLVVAAPTIAVATTQTGSGSASSTPQDTALSSTGAVTYPVRTSSTSSNPNGLTIRPYINVSPATSGIELPVSASIDYQALLTQRSTDASKCAGQMESNGNGVFFVYTDQVTLNFHVETTQATGQKAQDATSTVISAVFQALEELGVDKANISTTNIYTYPNWVYCDYSTSKNCQPTIVNYTSTYDFNVLLYIGSEKSTELASQALGTALAVGGDPLSIQGLAYDASPELRQSASTYARVLAMQDALAKLATVKEAMGVKIGPFLTINVYDNTPAVGSQSVDQPQSSMVAGPAQTRFVGASVPLGSAAKVGIYASVDLTVALCN